MRADASARSATRPKRTAATTRAACLWSPGAFTLELRPNRPVDVRRLDRGLGHHPRARSRRRRSPRTWPAGSASSPPRTRASRTEPAAELVLAADQFIITPAGRVEDAARARAAGDEVRTVIAGYHWFTDWGRDTMISLEGLTLTTGRHHEAGWILRTFAHYVRDGLIPNLFPEGKSEGLYHTADATLWFFHALDRYLEVDAAIAPRCNCCCRSCVEIAEHHLRGTRFGIGVDPADGLLRQGEEGYQLTWMDAKVDGWVVTPRRGKAVEINALWYNALRLLADWLREERGEEAAQPFAEHAAARPRILQPPLLVRGARPPARRRRWRARRRPRAAPQSNLRHLAAPSGARRSALARRAGKGARRIAHARRPALARARASRLQSHATSATCARATRPIIRAPSGAGSSARSSTPG